MAFQSEIECPIERVDLQCPFCHSSKVVKHGRTSAGNVRYRCIFCRKTWVQTRVDQPKPDFALLTEAYLSGYSYRDLRMIYHSSPIRINEKIRQYLLYCPSWEDYLDACKSKYQPLVIHLVGCKLKCKSGNSPDHSVYLALAIDALSTVVLGFELGSEESKDVWLRLLDRLNCRGIICPTFITYGQKIVNEALGIVFPYSDALHNFTRVLHDKELKEEVSRISDPKKVIRAAIESNRNNQDTSSECCLELFKDIRVKQIVYESEKIF
ncbi:MAG: IS1/IS1595 family N-terminal zinc-binding domain-containing protein [Candidatus Kryptoniota bacterium]